MQSSSAHSEQSTAVSNAPVFANGQHQSLHNTEADEINLAQVVQFFRRHLRLILGLAFFAGMITAVIVFLLPRKFEASTILVISPSKFSSELKPSTLTVQGYQKLLESDAVLAETKRRLVTQNVLTEKSLFRVGEEVETRIFVSRSSETTFLAPMLQVVALRAKTPAQAAVIANTWAQVFFDRLREITAGSTNTTIQLLEEQYPQARDRLVQLENGRTTTATESQKRYDEAAARWDQKLAAFKNDTADQVVNFQTETARLLVETSDQFLNSSQTKEGIARESSGKFVSTLQDTALQQKLQRLAGLYLQLAQTPRYLMLEKAMADDPLWLAMALQKNQDINFDSLQNRRLRTQERNPAYTELETQLAQLSSEASNLNPQSTRVFRDMAANLEKLQRSREAGLEKLKEQRAIEAAALDRERKLELDSISREKNAQLSQFKREIAQQRKFYTDLASNYNQAMLAKSQENLEDVRLGAAAVPPDAPKPRNLIAKSLLAAFLGGLFALFSVLIRDIVASVDKAT